MFHVSNFGSFGHHLRRFADLEGYVPEDGDDLSMFDFPRGWFDADWLQAGGDDPDGDEAELLIDEAWREHVAAAVEATAEAERALAKWQRS